MRGIVCALLLIKSILSAAPQDAITLDVGIKTLVFHDDKREKILITEIFYPAEGEKSIQTITTTDIFDRLKEARNAPLLQKEKEYPLIVMSHGKNGDRFTLAWLGKVLAAHGFIVASVDHSGSTWSNRNPEEAIKRWKRTDDIMGLIDAIMKDPLFGPHVNEQKIGMVGYSLGSLTGLWLAGATASQYRKPEIPSQNPIEVEEGLTRDMLTSFDLREARKAHPDPRIKSFVLLAPVFGYAFTVGDLLKIKAPVLLIADESDQSDAVFFSESIPTASLILLEKTDQKRILKEILKFFDQTL